MLKKRIKYTNLDGMQVEEDFYFHLSKAELAEMELLYEGGLSAHLQKVVESDKKREILEMFKTIITTSYGIRGDDGKQFIKNPALTEVFRNTDAFSELLMEFFTNVQAATEFIRGILPADLVAKIGADTQSFAITAEAEPPKKLNPVDFYTEDELVEMPEEDFSIVIERAKHNLPKQAVLALMRRRNAAVTKTVDSTDEVKG